MQLELRALQPQLVKTVADVEQLMQRISREKKEVVEPKVGAQSMGLSTETVIVQPPVTMHTNERLDE